MTLSGWVGVSFFAVAFLLLCAAGILRLYRNRQKDNTHQGGVAHNVPADLREALSAKPELLAAWPDRFDLAIELLVGAGCLCALVGLVIINLSGIVPG